MQCEMQGVLHDVGPVATCKWVYFYQLTKHWKSRDIFCHRNKSILSLKSRNTLHVCKLSSTSCKLSSICKVNTSVKYFFSSVCSNSCSCILAIPFCIIDTLDVVIIFACYIIYILLPCMHFARQSKLQTNTQPAYSKQKIFNLFDIKVRINRMP